MKDRMDLEEVRVKTEIVIMALGLSMEQGERKNP